LPSSVFAMADDQPPSNEIGEGGEGAEGAEGADGMDYEETTAAAVIGDTSTPGFEDLADVDEPLQDYVVNMVVNEDGATLPPDLVQAAVTDIHGNLVTARTSLSDAINTYSSTVYDQLNSTDTGVAGSKRWWGWSTKKILLAALIALCILGLILAIVFFVLKKFKKNKKPVSTGTSATAQAVVNKGVSPNPKYHQVPSV